MVDSPSDTHPLEDLRRRLRRTADLLAFVPGDHGSLAAERTGLLTTINGYLLPRLRPDAVPQVVAVSGLGGVGKSHIVNRLVGRTVTVEGPVRPSTVNPMLIAPHRLTGGAWSELVHNLELAAPDLEVTHDDIAAVPETVLLDLPSGLDLAGTLLDLADMCLVVTTPNRYADASAWDLIDRLASSGIETMIVLNRAVAPDDEIADELRHLLEEAEIEAPVRCVTEGESTGVEDLAGALGNAVPHGSPTWISLRVKERMASIVGRIGSYAGALDEERREAGHLIEILDERYMAAVAGIRRLIEEGALARPRATWEEMADRIAGIVTHRVGVAAAETTAAWTETPRGAGLIATGGDALWRHPPDMAIAARSRLLGWPGAVEDLVVEDARRRRLRPAVRALLVTAVMERALGDEVTVRWRHRRRLQSGFDQISARARASLADITAELVASDRSRFLDRLGEQPGAGVVASLETMADELDDPSLVNEAIGSVDGVAGATATESGDA